MQPMLAAISAARSAMLASVARINAAASNTANAHTTGPLPDPGAAQPVAAADEGARVYQPVDVVLRNAGEQSGSSGVAATYRLRSPAYIRQYDPSAAFAGEDGIVAAPNVDFAEEAMGVIEASLLFKANVAVMKAADEMTRSVLDTTA